MHHRTFRGTVQFCLSFGTCPALVLECAFGSFLSLSSHRPLCSTNCCNELGTRWGVLSQSSLLIKSQVSPAPPPPNSSLLVYRRATTDKSRSEGSLEQGTGTPWPESTKGPNKRDTRDSCLWWALSALISPHPQLLCPRHVYDPPAPRVPDVVLSSLLLICELTEGPRFVPHTSPLSPVTLCHLQLVVGWGGKCAE